MEENHEQDRDSEVENESPSMSNNDEDANSDGDSMEVSGYGNDDEGENSNYRNGNVLAAAAAVELMRHSVMQGTHPGLNLAEGHERGHEDILSKLKSQVRDMKVDSSQLNDLATTAANLTTNNLMQDHLNAFRARAPTTPFLFAPNRVSIPEDGNFQFTSPMQFSSQLHHFMPQAAPSAANNPGSNPPSTSPQSSEGSGGSNQNNWSFEEQFKQMTGGNPLNIPGFLNNNYLSSLMSKYQYFDHRPTSSPSVNTNQSYKSDSNNPFVNTLSNGHDKSRLSVSPIASRRIEVPKLRLRGGQKNSSNLNSSKSAEAAEEEAHVSNLDCIDSDSCSTTFQVHQKNLYELTEDAGRKIMLDELFTFNQKRGSPINRLPIMAKTVLDLYELFNLVVARGGLVEVINKKLWQEIIKGLKLPSSITSAAFTLRTQYMKFLFAYECEKYHFSTSEELQSAIDGNRREGRRSSYGSHYENMRPSGRSPNPAQMAQIAAVTRQQQQHQEHQLLSRLSSLANGHPVMHPPGLGQLNGAPLPGMGMPNLNMNSLEHYAAAAARIFAERGSPGTAMHPATTQAELNRSPSPNHHHVLTSLNNSMVLFNSILNNNNNNNINIKPAPQEEALNLSEAAQPTLVKRERADKDDGEPPSPKKRSRESSNDEASLARVPHQPLNNHHAPQRTNIVINNREGDPANGVFVSMEVNGVAYQGMLFPVPDDKVKTSNKKNGS